MINKYYLKRDGKFYIQETKEEISSMINLNNQKTFLYYLKLFDYPYIEDEWNKKVKNYHPDNQKNILGRYISTMRLKAYRSFSYQDSDDLNERRK